jgi:hypothetical protein
VLRQLHVDAVVHFAAGYVCINGRDTLREHGWRASHQVENLVIQYPSDYW